MTKEKMSGMPSIGDVPDEKKDLAVPSHEDDSIVNKEKPSLINPEENDSLVDVVPIPKAGIVCVAEMRGFVNGHRISEDDKFTIKSEKQFGRWFKCVDPVMEKKRKEFCKSKKAKK